MVCPDAFKGSLTAAEAAAAIGQGVTAARPDARVDRVPLADGGEGTLDVLAAAWGVDPSRARTTDALGRPTDAAFGVTADRRLGVVELAQASGLPGVADVPRQPLLATTRGTGTLLRGLLDEGVDEVLVCLGGSATTDGGSGVLRALGARLLDASGREVGDGGGALSDVAALDLDGLDPRARQVRWRLAVDVTNPLVGPRGAAAVFAPQKGARPSDVAFLDAALGRWAGVLAATTGTDVRDVPGAGAAGGVAGALHAVLGAELAPGARLVAEAAGLPRLLDGADLVLTGEGSFDSQSLGGKVVGTVAELAAAARPDGARPDGVRPDGGRPAPPVVVLAGQVLLPAARTAEAGIRAAFSIATGPSTFDELAVHAPSRLTELAEHVARLTLR
ncbi:glycerate kinase [Luteimicrobium subarcticum]|uniref:Glycerate kinase n=1 Tax=Luteimicrobium subarcticum TaxID=620910 RepID=A0A2M8WTA8_9MICO|nr:glycerate kinase [Luteimicrobium subarcticum]